MGLTGDVSVDQLAWKAWHVWARQRCPVVAAECGNAFVLEPLCVHDGLSRDREVKIPGLRKRGAGSGAAISGTCLFARWHASADIWAGRANRHQEAGRARMSRNNHRVVELSCLSVLSSPARPLRSL